MVTSRNGTLARNNFTLARNPSRVDAKRGDHFLQADLSVPIRISQLDYFRIADHPPRIVACPDTAELLSLGARYTVFESRFVPFYGTRREARLGLIYHAGRQTNLSRQSVAGYDTPGRDCTYRIPRPLPHPWDRRPMAANDHHDGIANS